MTQIAGFAAQAGYTDHTEIRPVKTAPHVQISLLWRDVEYILLCGPINLKVFTFCRSNVYEEIHQKLPNQKLLNYLESKSLSNNLLSNGPQFCSISLLSSNPMNIHYSVSVEERRRTGSEL